MQRREFPPGPHKSDGLNLFRAAIDRVVKVGLSKAAQAESMGWLPMQLSHLYHGRRRPTIDQAIEIEARYGVPVADWRKGQANG